MSGELDAWAAAGRTATLWWRDDDAVAPTRALDTLIAHGERHGVPLCLAVIPARAEPALATRIAESAQVAVAVHGYDHVNRAAPGERKCELCPSRDPEEAAAELSAGRARLTELFGEQAIALLVPPWNRIAAAVVPHLPAVGFAGLSALGPRASALPAPGLVAVNTHADIIDWKVRRFIGTATASERLVRHLQSRRPRHGGRRRAHGPPDPPLGSRWRRVGLSRAPVCAHPRARRNTLDIGRTNL